MVQANPWEDYEWGLIGTAGHKQIHHLTIQDVRRNMHLAMDGRNAIASETVFAAQEEEGSKRFASAWEDTLLPYPETDLVYSTSTPPTPSEYVGNVQYPEQRPGSLTVYFERSFTHSLQGVTVATDPKGEFIFNATQIQKYGIYNENGSTVDIDGTLESWYEEVDDFRPGTPFIISGCANAANDGFYRVRSVRQSGSYVYVTPDDNAYTQQELAACGSGGSAECDFGGDWYTFVGMNGNSLSGYMTAGGQMSEYFDDYGDSAYLGTVRDRWWSAKDLYHRYQKTSGAVTFGPNDGRPPTGGQMSKDFNADWVRCQNPSLYHTYDKNAHRFHVEAEEDGSITGGDYDQFTALIPSHKFLCFDADPKEQESPFFFEDTQRIHWKYGKKVRFRAADITNPSKLGSLQAVRSTGYWTGGSGYVGTGTDHQYNSTYTRSISNGETCEDGYLPVMTGQSYMSKWINTKYDDALQNMIELAASRAGWVWPVDNDYKYNWVWVHKYTTIDSTHQDYLEYLHELEEGNLDDSTYWDIYTTYGLSEAYLPEYNPNQPEYDYMNSEYWGENGSAFELILKLLGSSYYDWYYDETYPYRSKRILDEGWEWLAPLDPEDYSGTYNGISCANSTEVKEACWLTPVGIWRRTWKYTYGRVKPCKMRDGSRTAPGGFPTAAAGGNWPYEFYHPDDTSGNKTIRMIGRVVMDGDEPADSDFYTWSESGWTVPDAGKPDTIRFSGDKTDEFISGNIVWTQKSGEYYSYYVLKVVYDSVADTTTITLSDAFSTDAPSVLYGDINLSETHDPVFVLNDTPCYPWERLRTILVHSRSILSKLKYEPVTDAGIGMYNKTIGSQSYSQLYPADTYRFSSMEEIKAIYEEDYNDNWDEDMSAWSGPATSWPQTVGYTFPYRYIDYDIYHPEWDGTWDASPFGIGYTEQALKLTAPVFYDKDGVTFNIRLGFRKYGDPLSISPTTLGIVGVGLIDPPPFDIYPLYEYLYFPVTLKSDETQYIRLYCLGDWNNVALYETWAGAAQGGSSYYAGACVAVVLDYSGMSIIAEFNWSKFNDAIWTRTHERADYKLIDSFGPDTKPPVVKNEWVTEPTLYDANFDTLYAKNSGSATDYNYPYDQPNYTPLWKIKAEAVLMEDLEGNGVEYIFDYDHDTYDTEADAMDATQTSRKYNKTLGASGDSDDAFAALEALIDEWEVTLNSKDCYSGNVPGADDNYGTPTAAVDISIESPIFPMMARWVPEATHGNPLKVYLDYDPYSGQDRNWLLFIVDEYLPGQSNTSLQYKIECEKPDGTVYELTWHTQYGGSLLTDDYPEGVTINDLPSIANGNHKLCLWLNLDDNPSYYVAGMKYRVVVQEGSGPERTAWSEDSTDPTTFGDYTIEPD